MRHRETIFLDSSDIKTIIAELFNTEEYNVDILIDNDQYGRSVQIRVERAGNTTIRDIVQIRSCIWRISMTYLIKERKRE